MIKNDKRIAKLKKGEIIPMTFDFVFTSIFNNEENIDILENFLSVYFDKPLIEIKGHVKIKPRDLIIKNKSERNKQVDLILDIDGKKINIELNNYYLEGVKNRNVVYQSNIHGRQLRYKDNNYSKIKDTIQICLNHFRCNTYGIKDTYYFRNESGEILTEKSRIDYVDLVNAGEKRYNESEEKLARWCRTLTAETLVNLRKEIGDDLMEKEVKDKLEDEVNKYSEDDEVIALYSAYSREELERNTLIEEAKEAATKQGFNQGLEQGLEQGIEQGIEQNKIEMAKKMLDCNLDINIISDVTSLSRKEISKLIN